MGYYVNLEDVNVIIHPSLFAPVCEHLLSSGFLTNTDSMGGGSFGGGQEPQYWYAWVNMDTLTERLKNNDLVGVLTAFGFDVYTSPTGCIVDLSFNNKTGDEEALFRAMAPVLPGTYVLFWSGEDGARWKWVISDHAFRVIDAVITYPEELKP